VSGWRDMKSAPRDGTPVNIKIQLVSGAEKIYEQCRWHESRIVQCECCEICGETFDSISREGWYSNYIRLPICKYLGWKPLSEDLYRCMSCRADNCECSKLLAERAPRH